MLDLATAVHWGGLASLYLVLCFALIAFWRAMPLDDVAADLLDYAILAWLVGMAVWCLIEAARSGLPIGWVIGAGILGLGGSILALLAVELHDGRRAAARQALRTTP